MANRVYETMTLHRGPKYRVRVWKEVPIFRMGPDADVIDGINSLVVDKLLEAGNLEEACRCLVNFCGGTMPFGVTAIEILDNEGNGAVYYPDWK